MVDRGAAGGGGSFILTPALSSSCLKIKKNSGRYAQEMLSALSPIRQLQLNFPTNNLSVHVFNCRSSRKCHLLVEFPRADFLFLRAQILFLTGTHLCNFNSVCQRE